MLVLDAVLTGAKGVNLWSSFRGSPPQRKARLYTALVERGLASSVSGALLADRAALPLHAVVHRDRRHGARRARSGGVGRDRARPDRRRGPRRDRRAKRQLRARLVFENDSVTNIAHQLGYFETVDGAGLLRLAAAAHRRRHGRTGLRCRTAPACARPAGRSAGSVRWSRAMTPILASSLSPVRADARQRRGRHRPGDVVHARRHHQRDVSGRQSVRARSPAGPRVPDGPGHRSGHRASIGGRDRRRARRAGYLAARRDHPPHDDAFLHLPGGGLRRGAGDRHGRRQAPGFPGARAVEAPRRGDHRGAAGRRQPGGPGGRGSLRASVRRGASVRPARQGRHRDARAHRSGRHRRAFTADTSVPRCSRSPSSATSARRTSSTAQPPSSTAGRARRRGPIVVAAARRFRRSAASRLIAMPGKSQTDIAYGFTSDQPARPALLRVLDDEQRARAVRPRRAARRQHPRAAGDGVLRVQHLRSDCRRRAAASCAPASIPLNVDRAIEAIDTEVRQLGRRRPDGGRGRRNARVPDRVDPAAARDQPQHRRLPADVRAVRPRPRLRPAASGAPRRR